MVGERCQDLVHTWDDSCGGRRRELARTGRARDHRRSGVVCRSVILVRLERRTLRAVDALPTLPGRAPPGTVVGPRDGVRHPRRVRAPEDDRTGTRKPGHSDRVWPAPAHQVLVHHPSWSDAPILRASLALMQAQRAADPGSARHVERSCSTRRRRATAGQVVRQPVQIPRSVRCARPPQLDSAAAHRLHQGCIGGPGNRQTERDGRPSDDCRPGVVVG
jgi:hypothetical protein